jgi:hypothetical protein
MFYLNYVCKSYEGSEVFLADDSKPTWEYDVDVVPRKWTLYWISK